MGNSLALEAPRRVGRRTGGDGAGLGSLASQGFLFFCAIVLEVLWRFAETVIYTVKWPKSIAEICAETTQTNVKLPAHEIP